uniref:Ankyrin repeat protein n=2 Tax=Ditylum brightwellii TaxID=49249 RepID=A0A7S4VC28_9STRA
MSESNLYNLLHLDCYGEEEREKANANADAIISQAQKNPRDLDLIYSFPMVVKVHRCCPLHQAIRLGLGVEVIDALSSPAALKLKCDGTTALHLAMHHRHKVAMDALCNPLDPEIHVSWDVVRLLMKKHPGAAREKDNHSETPLHLACRNRAPLDVVSPLLCCWPDAAKERDNEDRTPLHNACQHNCTSSLDVVSALLSSCPDATKMKDSLGLTPLHVACRCASFDVVSLVLSAWPDALKERDDYDWTPLHCACEKKEASYDVVSLLLNSWPDAVNQEEIEEGLTPLHIAFYNVSPMETIILLLDKWIEVSDNRNKDRIEPLIKIVGYEGDAEERKELLHYLCSLFDEETQQIDDDFSQSEIMRYFVSINWLKGIFLAINMYPTVTKSLDLHTNIMADFLSVVGKRCHLKTMSTVIQNEPELLENVYTLPEAHT